MRRAKKVGNSRLERRLRQLRPRGEAPSPAALSVKIVIRLRVAQRPPLIPPPDDLLRGVLHDARSDQLPSRRRLKRTGVGSTP